MRLDGNFYKKEINERISELNPRRNNIKKYLLTRYGMNPYFATKVTDILEKTPLKDNLITSGVYDVIIEMTVQQILQNKTSSISDNKHIKKSERNEHSSPKKAISSQQQNNLQQQYTSSSSEEQNKELETIKQQYLELMQKLKKERQQLKDDITAKRSGRK